MTSVPLRIATRKSALALWQSEHVAELLRRAHPGLQVQLVPMSTRGDQVLDRPLADIGGKGLFLKELEIAMAEGRADLAVHSLKDVPAQMEAGFELGAILPRADAADAFVSTRHANIDALPEGARVGTSSLRRQVQLRALRPDCVVVDLRGNVGTRLSKLEAGECEAILLACAGLERLGLSDRIRERLTAPDWLPAPGQGAITVEMRSGNARVAELLQKIDDPATRCATDAERAMSEALGGNCDVPIGAWCVLGERALTLYGMVGDLASGHVLRAHAEHSPDDPRTLGLRVADALLEQGAGEILARAQN